MASAQQLSAYFASFGFKLDMKSVANVKKQITSVKKSLERSLQLTMVITKIKLGSKRQLNADIRTQMAAFQGITLKVSSFKIDAAALRRAVQDAYDRGVTLTLNPRVNRTGGGGGAGNNLLNNSRNSRFNNIPRVMDRLGTGVATMATGMGMWEINRISEDLQTSKVALGTITEGRGEDAYNWLRERGKDRGFDYSTQLPVFSSYLAASINKQGYSGSLESFGKLTDYGLTHGADKEGLKRAMTALGQMWSKGQIHQEELKGQLSEAKGFAGAREHFATAWQDFTGGKLTGQKAEAALLDAMKKGLVKSADVLPLVIAKMGEKAAGGMSSYKQTTGAAHGKFDSYFKESIEVFGKGGFDEGMRNFFETLAEHMKNSTQLLSDLGKMFRNVMRVFLTFIDTGLTFLKLLNDIHPALSGMLALLYPLWRIFGKWGAVIGVVMLALEDIQVYLDGGVSLIGQFAAKIEELFGIDPDPLLVAFGLIGAAIAAAFSPITFAIMGIAALIELSKRWEKSRLAAAAQPEYNPTNAQAPSDADINAHKFQMFTEGKADYYSAKLFDTVGLLEPMGRFFGQSKLSNKNYKALNQATYDQLITKEQALNYQTALGLGVIDNKSISQSLNQMYDQKAARDMKLGGIASDMLKNLPPLTFVVEGTATNQTFEFNLNSANGVFGNQAVPAQQ